MGQGFSFRTRVLLSFFLVIALGVLAPSWYFRSVLLDELRDESASEAERLLLMAEHTLRVQGLFSRDAQGATDLGAALEQLARMSGIGAVYLDAQGVVVAGADNAALVGRIPPSLVQEGAAGIADGRVLADYSRLFEQGMVRAWRGVLTEQGAAVPSGYLGLALPSPQAGAKLERINRGLLYSLMAASVLAGVFGLVLVRWLWRSMQSLVSVAESIGKGNYRERAGEFACRELADLGRAINLMAMRIEAHIATITQQKEQFEIVLNSMNEGVMVLDASCRIISTNRALKRIFPDAENSVGRRPLEVVSSPELQKACLELAGAKGAARGMRSFQIEPRKDAVYDVAIVSLGRAGESPDELGVVAVFHDISTLSRLERVRSDFVANVSHELRTPLTSIKGYAETLLDTLGADKRNTEAQRTFLEIILRNANHMSKMVNDLLNLARLEGGKRPFEVAVTDASLALAQAFKECMHLVEDRGVAMELDVPKAEALVMADHDRLTQIFRNLLENAIKYGAPQDGDEQARVRVWHEHQQNAVMFCVADNGPGIPREERQRVFERFYRVEKHRAKEGNSSSGLGLAITRHMVEKMGGEIWVQSPASADRGAIFRFTLPARDAGSTAPA
jgi:two-component system, OmpR family, phosphate regulon sensor histidine kinase PhoR